MTANAIAQKVVGLHKAWLINPKKSHVTCFPRGSQISTTPTTRINQLLFNLIKLKVGAVGGGRRPLKKMGGESVVIIFDFDRTLIEDDSDRWVLTNMGLTQLFNHLRPTLTWNSLMDRLLEELHTQGKTIGDIAECLKGMPLHPHVIAAIKSAHALGCDLKVASDSNSFYIKTILEHYGIYDCFSEIITNPAVVDNGRLRIFPYHDHGCDLCPPNLCKGIVIKQIQASISESRSKRIIYAGDGRNDFCPTLKLGKGDCVMPRKGFPLWDRIMKKYELIKAQVYDWDSSEDLARILLKLINSESI